MSKASTQRWNDRRAEKRRMARLEREMGYVPTAGPSITAPILPTGDMTAEELIEWRVAKFEKKEKAEAARKLITVDIPVSGPFGVLHFGDPHVDDDGTDWRLLLRHIDVIKSSPAIFAANVGDTRNNWVGRLARLFGQQGTSAREARILADHFLRKLEGKWAYIIGGNHDAWSGDDDPLEFISSQIKALYEPSEARLALRQPDNRTAVVVNARHDFKGNSQWNSAHAVAKAAQLGVRDDILICGHKHQSGYNVLKDPESGKLMHAIQVASYKIYDRFAKEQGFKDQTISPCVFTVIDPDPRHPANRVQVFWDPEAGAAYLDMLRRR